MCVIMRMQAHDPITEREMATHGKYRKIPEDTGYLSLFFFFFFTLGSYRIYNPVYNMENWPYVDSNHPSHPCSHMYTHICLYSRHLVYRYWLIYVFEIKQGLQTNTALNKKCWHQKMEVVYIQTMGMQPRAIISQQEVKILKQFSYLYA